MPMSDEHKEALARGRRESRAVKQYLTAISAKKQRGRPVTPDRLKQRIAALEKQIDATPDPLRRLSLVQQRISAEQRLGSATASVDMPALEKEFASVAKAYSERRGLTYSAWREVGVPAEVLRRAGIPRTRAS